MINIGSFEIYSNKELSTLINLELTSLEITETDTGPDPDNKYVRCYVKDINTLREEVAVFLETLDPKEKKQLESKEKYLFYQENSPEEIILVIAETQKQMLLWGQLRGLMK